MATIEPSAAVTPASTISRSRRTAFLRHYLEMCAPMCIGFAVGDLVYFWAAEQQGYSDPFRELPALSVLVVTFTMTVPMTAWMLFRGMPRRATAEMSAVMPVLAIALLALGWLAIVPKGRPRSYRARADDAGDARPDALPARPLHRPLGPSPAPPALSPMAASAPTPGIDLYWLPLGAGGHSVRLNGRIFEAAAALLDRRDRRDLYHSALQVYLPEARFVIEQAPVWRQAEERGVVAEGAVGAVALARLALFRYEVRRWREGVIPDLDEAVESPNRLSDDPVCARRLLELVREVPTPVWGRDDLHAGEMWNSNSTISWLIARSGLDVEAIPLPRGGRAPGWRAGIVVARRHEVAWLSPRYPEQFDLQSEFQPTHRLAAGRRG